MAERSRRSGHPVILSAPDAITPATVAALRAYWHGAEPTDREPPPESIALRDLRFARVGEVLTHSTSGDWHRLVAELLAGQLAPELAPCTRRGAATPEGPHRMAVRGLRRTEIDWGAVEPREWRALERVGLSRAVSLRLQSGKLDAQPEAPAPIREAARALLAAIPAGNAADRLAAADDAIREALYGDALARAGGNRKRAAELLGVAPSRVQEALRASPALAAEFPAGPRGPAPRTAEPCPTCGYAPCRPECPGPAYAIPLDER